MITLALAGKPNSGKSTFFKAATLAHAEIAAYPFTTIDANFGVAYVRATCPCRELGLDCTSCKNGNRYIPVNLIDVAGLVPDAHKGRGLGNQFLDNLRQADVIIQLVDASGATDSEGNPVEPGSHDPVEDIKFLRFEMVMWVYGILDRHWAKLQRQAQVKTFSLHKGIEEVFAGLGITHDHIRDAEEAAAVDLAGSTEDDRIRFCSSLVEISKPMLAVGNKADLAPDDLIEELKGEGVPLSSAASELALRTAAASDIISYEPGDPSFTVLKEDMLSQAQKSGLATIARVMQRYGGTGVQQAINHAVFNLLDMITVYPVEDENKFCDAQGRVLPDAFLMKKGATPRDLAFQVHTDIGEGFLYAVDARTKMRVKDSHVLQDGDIIRIVSTAK